MRREPEKWEALTTVSFINIYLEGCRGAVVEHSGVHLHRQGWKWSWGNVFLRYPPLHPNLPAYSALLLAPLLLPALVWSFQTEVGSCLSFYCSYTYTQLYTPKDKVSLANEKQNFSALAPFSSLTAPRQKRIENAAVTGTLQENKLKDFSKAKASVA